MRRWQPRSRRRGEHRHRDNGTTGNDDAWNPRGPARRRIRVLHTDSRVSWLLAQPRLRVMAIRKSDTHEDPQSRGLPCMCPAPLRGERTAYCEADSVVSGSNGTP